MPMEHVLVALLGAGGAATVWAGFKGIALLLGATGQFRTADRRSLAEEWQQLLNVQAAEAAALGDEVRRLQTDLRRCELNHEQDKAWRLRAGEWIEAAQEGLQEAKVRFRPWNPDPQAGSNAQHQRLDPVQTPTGGTP